MTRTQCTPNKPKKNKGKNKEKEIERHNQKCLGQQEYTTVMKLSWEHL